MPARNVVGLAGAALCACLLTISALTAAQGPAQFKVQIRYSEGANRGMAIENADLLMPQQGGKLEVRHKRHPLSVELKDIDKVVLEVSRHMRGGLALSFVGMAGAAAMGSHLTGVEDYWCLVMSRDATGTVVPYLIEVKKEDMPKVGAALEVLLGDRLVVTEFPEKEARVEKDTLKDVKTKHSMDTDEANHPIPEIKPDKALVVVVCPSFPTGGRREPKIMQQKLHANDKVVAVNKMGSYSFCYLDPGDYRLVSQAAGATGFTMRLEPGQDYYFFQNTYLSTGILIKVDTSLSRQSKELALYELTGARYSVWKEKSAP